MKHFSKFTIYGVFFTLLFLFPVPSSAAEYHLDGSAVSLIWGIPFAGILLSIALFPLFATNFWHHHYDKVALFWVFAIAVPFVVSFGWEVSLFEFVHVMLLEYIPFIILIFVLYVTAGGIHIKINTKSSPFLNTVILIIGSFLASLVGTTGASMILIRPIIAVNRHRRHQVHVIIFFIFTVANIGGSLSPIGDPPLFLGFLKGVPFFWPTVHLFLPMIFATTCLLTFFFLLDSYLYKKETASPPSSFEAEADVTHHENAKTSKTPIEITGFLNIFLLLCVISAVIISGILTPFFSFPVFGVVVESNNLLRNVVLLIIAALSIALTSDTIRRQNFFNWEPMREVAKLFICIFITIVPVIAILKAGSHGEMAPLLEFTSLPNGEPNNVLYFWITGLLSGFLDNAPTYLVFFNAAGGNSAILSGELADTLVAISVGAVFMGANTYIGNAPNLMVKAIAKNRGISMPSFFGYIVWVFIFLVPIFVLVTYIFL